MAKFTLTIDCDNAAFGEGNAGAEVARILREGQQADARPRRITGQLTNTTRFRLTAPPIPVLSDPRNPALTGHTHAATRLKYSPS